MRTGSLSDPRQIANRKDEHLDIALRQRGESSASGFAQIQFEHSALPELDLGGIDLSTTFLGRRLGLPFLISSMTGGPDRGARINAHLAAAAEALQIPLCVGSQRIAIEGVASAGIGAELRQIAPSTQIWANLGAAQLVLGYGVDQARRAAEMIGADALIIHLNPLQEAIQPDGDGDWRGGLSSIEKLCRALDLPVVVKEVGYGISAGLARRLQEAGVAAVDVAGAGGTAWAAIEAERHADENDRAIGEAFASWGIPTATALAMAREACPTLPLIGSGGVRDGVDAAKAIRLGADIVGQAGSLLAASLVSAEAVIQHFNIVAQQLRIACFCTGSKDIDALKTARLLPLALPIHDL